MYRISGSCNRCGQCCGAPGSPNRDSPWPDRWPEALDSWAEEALQQIPILKHVLLPSKGGQPYWAVRLGGTTYRGIWIPGHGLCRDNPPWGDITTYEETCPFLGEQQPDGSYPCGLIGTMYEDVYYDFCSQMGTYWQDFQVERWQEDHPLCSYTFEKVE